MSQSRNGLMRTGSGRQAGEQDAEELSHSLSALFLGGGVQQEQDKRRQG
jgi:hypothetical protein